MTLKNGGIEEKATAEKELTTIRKIMANNISFHRKNLKLSRAELAKKIGVTEATIGQYERAERTPSFESLYKISLLFQVPIDTLVGNFYYEPKVDIEWLDSLGFKIKENDGVFEIYTRRDDTLSTDPEILNLIAQEDLKIFEAEENQVLIAKFTSRRALQACVKVMKQIFLDSLGVRHYVNRFFIELMTKGKIELPELIFIESKIVAKGRPIKLSVFEP